ncbi:MAG: D-alanyl-D-alanine carboxypeptidase [Lachnospiraceae bacterium]|nr:D-alanyl-D-alanine carboxypeptidase [Lachnospiraceae bacterium]
MKIISKPPKKVQKFIALLTAFGCAFCITGCGAGYEIPYTVNASSSSFRIVNREEAVSAAVPFASDLCVVSENVAADSITMNASGAALFDINTKETVYAKNVHEKLYPASLTKVMTALVALKHGSTDMLLTASENVTNLESDAQTCGIKPGDQMTLTQALHVLLINSANDAAIMIAEGIGGSVEGFAELMNQEALALGATNTHFVNPHGLSDDNHYTTVYDIYLIMNEAIKYDMFNNIIGMSSYSTVYSDKEGNSKELNVKSTNLFLHGEKESPAGVTVYGGKTGTTNAAGHCLVLLSRDTSGNPYISVILRADSRDELYTQMSELLNKINN